MYDKYMKYLINMIKSLFSKELSRPLGRWKIENCNKQLNNKVDLSNEDHCGMCAQYALSKMNNKIKEDKKCIIDVFPRK
jgi:hypothetical protein